MWVVWSLPPQGDSGGPYLHLPCSSASRSSTYIKLPSAFGTQHIAHHDSHRLTQHVGGLRPPPAGRSRRAIPSSLVQFRITKLYLHQAPLHFRDTATRQRQRTLAHRTSSRSTPDVIESRLFRRRSRPRSLTKAPRGGLEPASAGRLWRANKPPSPIQHRSQRDRYLPSLSRLPRSCSQSPRPPQIRT